LESRKARIFGLVGINVGFNPSILPNGTILKLLTVKCGGRSSALAIRSPFLCPQHQRQREAMWLNALLRRSTPHRQRASYRQPFRGKVDLLINNSNRGRIVQVARSGLCHIGHMPRVPGAAQPPATRPAESHRVTRPTSAASHVTAPTVQPSECRYPSPFPFALRCRASLALACAAC
jgi:hypothetical protein